MPPVAHDKAAGPDRPGLLLLRAAGRLEPEMQGGIPKLEVLAEPDRGREWSSDTKDRDPQSLRARAKWPVGFRKRGKGK